jgi:NADH-quinone oxidoreductase subunit J
MFSAFTTFASSPLLLALGAAVSPLAILVLCIVGGIGTVLLLPGRREPSIHKIGGVILLATLLVFVAAFVHQSAIHAGGDVYFWVFSGIAICSAIRVISHPKPVYSALYFVLTVLASAGLFVLLWAEFMAAALILIYAGAILVTYVFVIMLAAQAHSGSAGEQGAEYDRLSRQPILAAAVGFALMGVMLFLIFDKAQTVDVATSSKAFTTRDLGEYLFSSQVFTLELAGLLLTISMVGAVIIARRHVTEEGTLTDDERSPAEVLRAPAMRLNDDPHDIPVYGTDNPAAKAYPEN